MQTHSGYITKFQSAWFVWYKIQRKKEQKNEMTRQNAMKCVHLLSWVVNHHHHHHHHHGKIIMRTKLINIQVASVLDGFLIANAIRLLLYLIYVAIHFLSLSLSNNLSFRSPLLLASVCAWCILPLISRFNHWIASPLQKNDCAECAQTHSNQKTHWNQNKRLLFFCVWVVCTELICVQVWAKPFESFELQFRRFVWKSSASFCFCRFALSSFSALY